MRKDTGNFHQTIAWWLPKKLVYFCLIRGWANATTGEYSDTDAMKITADEVMRRWVKKTKE